MTVRTRFAPSPTGYLHIGGAHTALFSWMFARRHGGQFILRIEDTDEKRTIPGALEAIMESTRWLGLDWDEGPDIGGPYGPYIQSERAELYQKWAHWLVQNGHAYKCFATAEELEEMRQQQIARGETPGYDRRFRNIPPEQRAQYEASGQEYVIRLKMPLEGETVVPDLIRGDITFDNSQLTDLVLLKSSGLPTYHLANVVDDHFMEITHVTRGDEWINTAPAHIQLWKAFGWEMPIYAHLPVILNPSGTGKLSKRTQSFEDDNQLVLVRVNEFEEHGYLSEAVNNFLTNIGWSFGDDREIFPMAEAIERFDLKELNPAPTKLPYSKLDWMNGQYIQELPADRLAQLVKPYIDAAGYEVNLLALLHIIPAIRVRLKRLSEIVEWLQFLDDDAMLALTADDLTHKKMPQAESLAAFTETRDFLKALEPFELDEIGDGLREIGEKHTTNGKAGPYLGTMRLAVTGQKVSPPLFESILALGRDHALARIDAALETLQAVQ